jgi:hypothetical protein
VPAGEAVFAGTFDASSADPLSPDMDLAPAKATLADAALAARLKPAKWVNGETFPCALLRPLAIYALELPGVPFADDYTGGSRSSHSTAQ